MYKGHHGDIGAARRARYLQNNMGFSRAISFKFSAVSYERTSAVVSTKYKLTNKGITVRRRVGQQPLTPLPQQSHQTSNRLG
jgi:hypothetical protein